MPMADATKESTSQDAMLEEDVLACSFSAWFENFRDSTFKSEIIPLPEDFVEYLLADGIQVPTTRRDNDEGSTGSWGSGGDSDDESDDTAGRFHFEELEEVIRTAIQRLNGKVLPKLNWSAPKDAQWVHGSLKCDSPTEVFTLLKASDFIAHDLCHGFDHCKCSRTRPDEFTLVLRRWHSLHESNEFRAFVRDSQLIAISQRQTSALYEHLTKEEEVAELTTVIRSFFEQKVRERFPLSNYAFDVYVDIPPRRRVWLVDFSPWGATTDACLFDWEELRDLPAPGDQLKLRVVRDESECRGKLENFHRMPMELAQLNSNEGLNELLEKADKVLLQKEESKSGGYA
eukprot:TRINITY_DN42221_c0_g1_i1.p1 TRINITY_DN42221_c0_g1~~TRINITY_DN42221_c0_g1_i1.p1  ORF type:complete len:344 (-),score=73.03 TRINITY_DN42221_c0_g1_i1:59-1090(-)